MKTYFIKIVIIAFLAVAIMPSCKKYQDGPAFSLLTKKARLCGTWSVETITYNGVDQTAIYQLIFGANYVLNIEKDGKYKASGNLPDDGKWVFGEDKDDVYFTSSKAGSSEQAFRILRLKSKELWLRSTAINGDQTIIKYKQ